MQYLYFCKIYQLLYTDNTEDDSTTQQNSYSISHLLGTVTTVTTTVTM